MLLVLLSFYPFFTSLQYSLFYSPPASPAANIRALLHACSIRRRTTGVNTTAFQNIQSYPCQLIRYNLFPSCSSVTLFCVHKVDHSIQPFHFTFPVSSPPPPLPLHLLFLFFHIFKSSLNVFIGYLAAFHPSDAFFTSFFITTSSVHLKIFITFSTSKCHFCPVLRQFFNNYNRC